MEKNKIILALLVLIIIVAGFAGYKKFSEKTVVENTPVTSFVTALDITQKLEYKNSEYDFGVYLPNSWRSYSVVEGKWEGVNPGDNKVTETGPIISIRHPLWTKEVPRQDIPVMVFTTDQWDKIGKDGFHIGAAPINPSFLASTTRYVFALPARYNYAYPVGYEEVDQIINDKLVHALSYTDIPFSLNDKDGEYTIGKVGKGYALKYDRPGSVAVLILVNSATEVPLESYVGKSVNVNGKFETVMKQVQCIKAPCPAVKDVTLVIKTIGIKKVVN